MINVAATLTTTGCDNTNTLARHYVIETKAEKKRFSCSGKILPFKFRKVSKDSNSSLNLTSSWNASTCHQANFNGIIIIIIK
jgi:hypothetical protein